eukprot:923014_1
MSLNDDNFDGLVGKDQGVFVVFCTLWCHYCQALEPAWLNLSTHFENDKDKVLIARLDITKRDDVKLVQRFNVIHFPTLLWFPTGQSKDPKSYTDDEHRTTADLVYFVNKQIDRYDLDWLDLDRSKPTEPQR